MPLPLEARECLIECLGTVRDAARAARAKWADAVATGRRRPLLHAWLAAARLLGRQAASAEGATAAEEAASERGRAAAARRSADVVITICRIETTFPFSTAVFVNFLSTTQECCENYFDDCDFIIFCHCSSQHAWKSAQL